MEFNLNLGKRISSKIIISEDSRLKIEKLISIPCYHNVAVLVDETVYHIWIISNRNDFLEIKDKKILFIPGKGEEIKNLNVYEKVASDFLIEGIERDSLTLAIGGGALIDFAGFLASTFMRGLDLALVPTTLLAQIDASIGGKNGINLLIKNALGTFYLPKYVIIDPVFIETLPFEEYLNGIAEAIKYYFIKGKDFKIIFENKLIHIKERDKKLLLKLIEASVKAKLEIISRDLEEKNERMFLNFGHTIGHAIEILSEYRVKHGFAIAYGFIVESMIASSLLGFPREEIIFVANLIRELGFNLDFKIDEGKIIEKVLFDKKRRKGKIIMALPSEIGKFEIVEVSESLIKESIRKSRDFLKEC